MNRAAVTLALLVTIPLLGGCAEEGPLASKTTKGAIAGTLIGAGTGAIIGSATGNAGTGTAIGAGLGGLTGGLIGHQLQQQENKLKALQQETYQRDMQIASESYQRDQELRSFTIQKNIETQSLLVNLSGDLLFDTDASTIKPGAYRRLDEIAKILKMNPTSDIIVRGHTDSRGLEDYNMQLSQRRADEVKAYLAQRGVPATQITALGRGESEPIVLDNTPEAWAMNRRVEIEIRDRSN